MSDEHQRAVAVKTVAAVFMPIATIAVLLRCYVRGWIVKGFGWDDTAMVFALVRFEHPLRFRPIFQISHRPGTGVID